MENLKLGALCLAFWVFVPCTSRADGFLYLPITRSVVITASFCGYRTSTGSCHGGTDYDVRDDGDGIVAAAAGIVEVAEDGWSNTYGRRQVYGNYIQIRHENGYHTIYGHLKSGSLLVSVGDHVGVGTLLGIGDNSGWSTGSHLHFEVRDPSGNKVDPYGESPRYPNCGTNALWANCPPLPPDVDADGDTWTVGAGDCNDANPDIHPGAREICDGADNNCNGATDEEPAASDACQDGIDCTINTCVTGHFCMQSYDHSRCSDGDSCTTDICTLTGCRSFQKDDDMDGYVDTACGGDDCDDTDFNVHPGAAEMCNNLDDNCDGRTDETWRTGSALDLGEPCNVGFGVCMRSGIWICEPFGRGTVCNGEHVSGTTEICGDHLDNDCDGATDEDCCSSGLTRCSGGCVNLMSDHSNCGYCGHICSLAGYVCYGGECINGCASPLTDCGGTCVNMRTDPHNCGYCGHVCLPGTTCTNWVCY